MMKDSSSYITGEEAFRLAREKNNRKLHVTEVRENKVCMILINFNRFSGMCYRFTKLQTADKFLGKIPNFCLPKKKNQPEVTKMNFLH